MLIPSAEIQKRKNRETGGAPGQPPPAIAIRPPVREHACPRRHGAERLPDGHAAGDRQKIRKGLPNWRNL